MNKIKLLFVFLLILPLSSCLRVSQTMFLGIFPFNVKEYEEYIDFTFDKIESKTMLKLIGDNAYSFERKKDIKSLIKKCNQIVLSIGIFDLLKGVYFENGEQRYKYLPSLLELFELNVYHIISSIFEYNKKISIIVLSLYNPYVFSDNSFYENISLSIERYNEVLKYVSEEFNLSYLDINEFCLLDEFNTFSIESKNKTMELIKGYAK